MDVKGDVFLYVSVKGKFAPQSKKLQKRNGKTKKTKPVPLVDSLCSQVKRYDYLCGHGQAEEEPDGAAAEGDGSLPVLQGGGLDRHQALQGGVCTGR
jgi:hypothetical protein